MGSHHLRTAPREHSPCQFAPRLDGMCAPTDGHVPCCLTAGLLPAAAVFDAFIEALGEDPAQYRKGGWVGGWVVNGGEHMGGC